jgi:DNA end-binding protein Ku
MAPARGFWKGHLKLSLVTCPIALYTGTSATERIPFRQINKRTGNRLRQQLVDEVTREPVEGEDKGRGYEYAKNTYVAAELEALAPLKSTRSSLASRSAKSGRTHLR